MATALEVRENVTVMQRAATALTLVEMRERVEQLDAFYRGLMQKGTDYDEIPGTNKPTLLQPGAQLACTYFGFVPTFEVLPASVENWEAGFFALTVRCRLMRAEGTSVAEGIGSCNSKEDKYRWRDQQPQCPSCGANTLRRGAQKYGGGYYCAAKSGGCGANFKGDSQESADIARQPTGRIENPEPWSLHNTILKMAEKRALVAATLNATGASRIFTQDVEDLPEFSRAPARPRVEAVDGEFTEETAGPPPASDDFRSKWNAQWARGEKAAAAVGVGIPDAPGATATADELRKASADLAEAIRVRKMLNGELVEKIAAVKAAHGPDAVNDTDPVTCTDTEVHEMLATLNEMLAAAPVDDQDEAF